MSRRWLFGLLLAVPIALYLLPGFAQTGNKGGYARFIHCQHSVSGLKGECTAKPQSPVQYKSKALVCEDCHGSEKITDKTWRPGHRPCVECHKRDFLKADASICYNCHETNDPAQKPPKFKALPAAGSEPDKPGGKSK
jgi:hypothetical protein